MQTFSYNNGTFAATDMNSWKVLYCLHDNMIVHGRPAEIRFREAVEELIAEGAVRGPLNVLRGPLTSNA